jgi:hypothetical protein
MVCSTRAFFTPVKRLNIYADIKATTAVLTTAASLLALLSLGFSVALVIDWIRYLCSPRPKLSAKEGDDEEVFDQSWPPPVFNTHTRLPDSNPIIFDRVAPRGPYTFYGVRTDAFGALDDSDYHADEFTIRGYEILGLWLP